MPKAIVAIIMRREDGDVHLCKIVFFTEVTGMVGGGRETTDGSGLSRRVEGCIDTTAGSGVTGTAEGGRETTASSETTGRGRDGSGPSRRVEMGIDTSAGSGVTGRVKEGSDIAGWGVTSRASGPEDCGETM